MANSHKRSERRCRSYFHTSRATMISEPVNRLSSVHLKSSSSSSVRDNCKEEEHLESYSAISKLSPQVFTFAALNHRTTARKMGAAATVDTQHSLNTIRKPWANSDFRFQTFHHNCRPAGMELFQVQIGIPAQLVWEGTFPQSYKIPILVLSPE